MINQKNIGTILFVDDDIYCHNVADLIISHLTKYRIIHAYTGAEAIELAQKFSNEIKIIFLDIMLPDMPGNQIYHQLSQQPKLKNIPIVIQSGIIKQDPKISKLLEFSNIDFLPKPYNKNDMLEIINKLT